MQGASVRELHIGTLDEAASKLLEGIRVGELQYLKNAVAPAE